MLADPARDQGDPRRARARWASGSRSTTSAPATPRSPTSSACPSTQIKIDRSFVMGMATDEDDATIVRSTIDLGRNLGLEVVAEGVEAEAIWHELRALGCTIAQGYYLSRPLPPDQLSRWLSHPDPRTPDPLRADLPAPR